MNKNDRALLKKHLETMREAADAIREIGEEERAKFDNMPEGLQQGENGQAMEEAADTIENAFGDVEGAIGELEGLV